MAKRACCADQLYCTAHLRSAALFDATATSQSRARSLIDLLRAQASRRLLRRVAPGHRSWTLHCLLPSA